MFCGKCGKNITIDGAVFCPSCGAKIPDILLDEFKKEKTVLEESVGKSDGIIHSQDFALEAQSSTLPEGAFQIANRIISFSDEEVVCTEILADIENNARECAADYVKFYKKCKDVDQVIKSSKNKIWTYYSKMAKIVSKHLVEIGVYGVDEDTIEENKSPWYKACSIVNQLIQDKSKLEQARDADYAYRDSRKRHRGRFIGGGFGLSGAIKGMAMAGTANMVTGAAHSVFNIFGNALTSSIYNGRKDALKTSGICGEIASAIENDCLLFADTLNDLLIENHFHSMAYNTENKEQEEKIIEQIQNGIISSENIVEALIRAIEYYPADATCYEELCYYTGDYNGEIKRCMEYFGLNTEMLEMVHASKVYRDVLFGERCLELLYKKDSEFDYDIIGELCAITRERINPYLCEDVNNVPHIFFADNKLSMENESYILTFEDGKNLRFVSYVEQSWGEAINLREEVPICFVKLGAEFMEEFPKDNYILVTSKRVILPKNSIQINAVTSVTVSKKAVSFSGLCSVGQTAFSRGYLNEELERYLFSTILFIQLSCNLHNKQKRIALLDENYDVALKDPYDFLKEDYISAAAEYKTVASYVSTLFDKADSTLLTTKSAHKNSDTVKAERKLYGIQSEQEIFVVMYCEYQFAVGSNGIYVTSDRVYFHQKKDIKSLALDEIKSFEYDPHHYCFRINGTYQIKFINVSNAQKTFADHFMQIVLMLQDDAFQQKIVGRSVSDSSNMSESEQDMISVVREACEAFPIPSQWTQYNQTIFCGHMASDVYVKNYDEIVEDLEITDEEEILFLYLEKSMFNVYALAITSRGFRAVNKNYTYDLPWERFVDVKIKYTMITGILRVNGEEIISLSTKGSQVYQLLQDIQEIAKKYIGK